MRQSASSGSWAFVVALSALWAGLGCADGGSAGGTSGGPSLAVDIAALSLDGVGDVVWDVEVDNGAGEVVWQRRLTSSGYGDGAGSASYVGPCDADPAVADNTVKVWVVGVYAQAVTTAGSFSSGAATGVVGASLDFENPTAAGPLTAVATCEADRDVAVTFDVTLMRPARQGFFDVAVSFNDIFCAAKFDCQKPDGADIALLFDAAGQRNRTLVLGFACTAGTGDGVDTQLYMDDLELDCTAPNDPANFSPDIVLRPDAVTGGNLCVAGPDGMSTCAPYVTELDPLNLDADTYLFQLATYRGSEALSSGGAPAQKRYWNVALGVKDAIAGCRLRARATADDAANTGDGVAGGTVSAGVVYPYVQWDVDLATCTREALTFNDPTAPVHTDYTDTSGAATSFAYFWAPGLPSAQGIVDNGGVRQWADGSYASSCYAYRNPDGVTHTYTGDTGDGLYRIDPSGGAPYDVYCDMTFDGGGWTRVFYQDADTATGGGFFVNNEFTKNKADPNAKLYAILDDLELFRRDGRFELKLDWPGSASFPGYQHWFQTSNPVTAPHGDTPTGVVPVHIDYTTNTTSSGTWGGLQRTAYQGGATGYPALLDGTFQPLTNWYYAVGSKACWVGPAPACIPGPEEPPVQVTELWVR